jgi:hypothetical protein
MRWPLHTLAAAVIVAGLAWPAQGGQVKLEIRNGLVTLDTKDATVREIFAEWARVGQTRVVNAERVTGSPMTLQLQNVPERQALEIILRSAAGYVAAPRALRQASLSEFDRIVLMPGARPASSPAQSSVSSPGPTQPPQTPFGRGQRFLPPPSSDADDQDEPLPNVQMPIPSVTRPGMPVGQPPNNSGEAPNGQNPSTSIAPMPQSASRPGMATPPAQPGMPNPPAPPIKH